MINHWRGYRRLRVLIGMISGLLLAGSTGILYGVDQANPVETANYILALIRVNDCDGLLEMMPEEIKNTYKPFTADKRDELMNLLKGYSEKIGDTLKVSEIREYPNLEGKTAVAAKVRKKGNFTFVIILRFLDNLYYYDNTQDILNSDYKALKLIKKAD